MSEDDFKVSQLTKELVAMRLARMEDPCAAAADSIRQTLKVALQALPPGDPERHTVIEDAVRGGMQGLILAEQDVPRGGALVVEAMAELAHDVGMDPSETIKSALAGLAGLKRLLRADHLDALREAIEEHFHGAGEVFSELLAAQPDPGQASRRV
ncbi:MAG: hypothetical protein KGL53_12925 [Elusimicrobia bacterium]|nr:hypothetical protein [Elusimicrobiota bacterium]